MHEKQSSLTVGCSTSDSVYYPISLILIKQYSEIKQYIKKCPHFLRAKREVLNVNKG